ncbi:MAG: NAD(P)-dependent glycerol-3-phosphate dehydrogenase [Chromatiales bacterium]|nr:NAD(P)-dependent glycerol-3-phosphate dehydrogenase [Chromatiales bacterium]
MKRRFDIVVLGAGSWGTALAILLARNGHDTLVWGRDEATLAAIVERGSNEKYLPGQRIPDRLAVEPDFTRAVDSAASCLVAVPSHAFGAVVGAFAAMPAAHRGVLWATKGLDPSSGRLLHEVAAERLPHGVPLGVLSGPTFAGEVARRLPTAVTLAATDAGFAAQWAARLANSRFRVYTSDDVAGVQIAGAVKNVLAIAAGIADGLGFGANARAALVARGLSEMVRLGEAAGGRPATFMGLAGLGDLVLTCTDDQSRNRRFGLALARGAAPDEAAAAVGQVVEGVETSARVMGLARRFGVEMPICEQVRAVVTGASSAVDAVEALLARDAAGPER